MFRKRLAEIEVEETDEFVEIDGAAKNAPDGWKLLRLDGFLKPVHPDAPGEPEG